MRLHAYITEDRMQEVQKAYKAFELANKYIDKLGWQDPDRLVNKLPKMKPILFRGYKELKDTFTHTQRADRRPLDSPIEVHDAADKWFLEKFGWRVRSEGMFVSPFFTTAKSYSKDDDVVKTYMVFPNGSFKYVWSKEVTDFYAGIASKSDVRNWLIKGHDYERFAAFMELQGYTDKNLDQMTKGEVALKASSFTLVNSVYYPHYCIKHNIIPDELIIRNITGDLSYHLGE